MLAPASDVRSKNSTTVRSPVVIPPPLRTAFGLLARVAPPLAARGALRLFATAPRMRAFPDATALWAHARTAAVRVGRHTVKTYSWGRGPTIVLLHGWGGRAHQLAGFVPSLVARGFEVVVPDAPAHGESPGRTTTVVAFADTLNTLAGPSRALAGVVAHSLGAGAAALALTDGLRVDRAVFLAPVTRLRDHFHAFLQAVGLPPGMHDALVDQAQRHYRIQWSDLDLFARADRGRAPLLLVHDRQDPRVSLADTEALARIWPGARVLPTEGLGHNRLLTSPEVVRATVGFVAEGAVP